MAGTSDGWWWVGWDGVLFESIKHDQASVYAGLCNFSLHDRGDDKDCGHPDETDSEHCKADVSCLIKVWADVSVHEARDGAEANEDHIKDLHNENFVDVEVANLNMACGRKYDQQ